MTLGSFLSYILPDLEEFHTLLILSIENEIAKVGAQQARVINKIRGREANEKAFLDTRDGRCNNAKD